MDLIKGTRTYGRPPGFDSTNLSAQNHIIIAVYPVATTFYFGLQQGVKVYGRVFTAWGLVGLAGPWIAGIVFDEYQRYSWTLIIAGVAAIGSAFVCLALPRNTELRDVKRYTSG